MTTHTVSTSHQARAHFHPKPDGRKDPAGEAGWYLQREREMRGVSLEKAGQDTGVHPHHLEAIEAGDLTRLPERAQALEMIGAYARYLGFDPQPLVAHFSRLIPKEGRKTPGGLRPFSSARIIAFPLIERLRSATSGAGGVAASVLAAVLLFGGAVWLITPGARQEAGSLAVAARQPAAEKQAAGGEERGVRSVASISRVNEEPLKDDAPAVAADSMEALIAQTVPGVAGAEKIAAPAAKPAGSGFVLRAVDDIWMCVEDREGNKLYSGVMKKGETYTVPARKGLSIITRDGGLLEWMLDGKVMGRLSAPGRVLVGKALDPAKLARRRG